MNSVLLVLACLAAPPAVVKSEPLPEWDARFRRTDGWVGGDGAYSVRTSDTRTLWLFSDTWVGSVRDGKRKDVTMVNNTVGVQDGEKLTFHIATKDGKPGTLFVPPDGKGWFWQFAGHLDGDKLHVFLPRFEKTNQPGAFGFKGVDLWLGTVPNSGDDPTKWTPTYAKVPFAEIGAKGSRSFGGGVLRVEDWVYVYGYAETPGKPFASRTLLTARVPAGKLADFAAWRFLADGEWKPDAKDATGQGSAIGTEFSVSFVPALKQYALVYSENGLSQRILGRFAASPGGPWSAPVLLHTCPEMKADKKVFTYAAKAHPHLSGESELVVSYVVNSFDLAPVINDATLYWPRFVRVTLK
ncbi:MAG TPA: DUF4185 domain-containing protein [Gemmataceae bacterium]|nr:DUF4185 domain-containing protein [Gemmataceae bacterium]